MNNSKYRNTLIAAGIAATLGLGAAGCGQRTDDSSTQTGTRTGETQTQDVSDSADSRTGDTYRTGETRTGETRTGETRTSGTDTMAGDTRSAGDSASRTASDAAQATGDAAERAGQAVSDTWITTKVKSVLLADSDASGLDLSVETNDGVVTLEGELTSQESLDHVRTLVMDVEGVRRVDVNALTVARR